jgi:hypothetical protein
MLLEEQAAMVELRVALVLMEQQIVEMAVVEQMDLAEHHQTAVRAVQALLYLESPIPIVRHSQPVFRSLYRLQAQT